jgi:hypothetical protein
MNAVTTTESTALDPRGMGKLKPSRAQLAERLNYDRETGLFTWKKSPTPRIAVGTAAGSTNEKGYIVIVHMGQILMAHRIAWLFAHGEWPKGDIDHINGNPADNRLCNLRDVTRSVNQQNLKRARRDNGTGLLGVKRARNGSFEARINVQGRYVHLGTFLTAGEAHQAYLTAKRTNHQGCTL